jgi:hypothetical protein
MFGKTGVQHPMFGKTGEKKSYVRKTKTWRVWKS